MYIQLDLSNSPRISFMAVKRMIDTIATIEAVHLEGCGWLEKVEIHSPSLKYLNFASCKNLEKIDLQCQQLEDLHLSWCTKLTTAKIICPQLSNLV